MAAQQIQFAQWWEETIWTTIASKYIQKDAEYHFFALYRLTRPTICKIYPKRFSKGTAKVKGIENDDKIDVIVEM